MSDSMPLHLFGLESTVMVEREERWTVRDTITATHYGSFATQREADRLLSTAMDIVDEVGDVLGVDTGVCNFDTMRRAMATVLKELEQ